MHENLIESILSNENLRTFLFNNNMRYLIKVRLNNEREFFLYHLCSFNQALISEPKK